MAALACPSSQTIPWFKQKRIANQCRSKDPVIQAILAMSQRSASLQNQRMSKSFCGTVISSKQCLSPLMDMDWPWLHRCHNNIWLEKPIGALTGADYIGAINSS